MRIQNEARPHTSFSQLNTYLQCPLAYYFQYDLGIPWSSTPSAVAFGGAIHKVVEYMNRRLMKGEAVAQDEVVAAFNEEWTTAMEDEKVGWRKPEEPAELLVRGQILVALYYNQFHSANKPQAVELQFRLPLLDPTTGLFIESRDVVGKIDCIYDDGTIVEIKTSGKSPNQAEINSNLQLTLYSWAYRMLYGLPEQKLMVVALVKTKEPKLQVLETRRAETDYTKLISLLEQVLKCIDQKLYYPNPIGGYGCGSCQYRDECEEKWPI